MSLQFVRLHHKPKCLKQIDTYKNGGLHTDNAKVVHNFNVILVASYLRRRTVVIVCDCCICSRFYQAQY
eukprot:m.110422 g.110422  ORF g.110422 m.110422 type:complete len:69 (+) comp13403_c0_seq1:3156-3362(+)